MDLDPAGHDLIQAHKHFFSFNVTYFTLFNLGLLCTKKLVTKAIAMTIKN